MSPSKLPPDALRRAYEAGTPSLAAIAASAGISVSTLRRRALAGGWRPRLRPKRNAPRAHTLDALWRMLDAQIAAGGGGLTPLQFLKDADWDTRVQDRAGRPEASGSVGMSGIRDISVQELLDRFVDVCLDQEDALSDEDYDKFNRLYDVRMDIQDELKRRGDKARRSLLRLYDHPNLTVQMFAAAATAGLEREAALAKLREIGARRDFLDSIRANSMATRLEEGAWDPD